MSGREYLQEIKRGLEAGRYQHKKGTSVLRAFGYSRRRKKILTAINREMKRLGLVADPPIDENMPLEGRHICFSLASQPPGRPEKSVQPKGKSGDGLSGLQLHPEIMRVSGPLFRHEHYSQAILEACKALSARVRRKCCLPSDGRELMARAFKDDDPVIELNRGRSQSDRDEREGFRFLFMGAMVGIRNPKAHELSSLKDGNRALEYLAFLSLLMRKVDGGKVVRPMKSLAPQTDGRLSKNSNTS